MAILITAAAYSHPALFAVPMAFGLLVGVFGHINHSRAMIITGILLIGLASAYFVAAGELAT